MFKMKYPTESIDESMSQISQWETYEKIDVEDTFVPEPYDTNLKFKCLEIHSKQKIDPNTSFLPTTDEPTICSSRKCPDIHGYFVDEDDIPFFRNEDSESSEVHFVWANVSSKFYSGINCKEPQETSNYCWKLSEEETVLDDLDDLAIIRDETNESVSFEGVLNEDAPVDESVVSSVDIGVEKKNHDLKEKKKVSKPKIRKDQDEGKGVSREFDNVGHHDKYLMKQRKDEGKIEHHCKNKKCNDKLATEIKDERHFNVNKGISKQKTDEKEDIPANNIKGIPEEGKGFKTGINWIDKYEETTLMQTEKPNNLYEQQKAHFLEKKNKNQISYSSIKIEEDEKSNYKLKKHNEKRKLKLGKWMVFTLVYLVLPSTQAQGCTDPYARLSSKQSEIQDILRWHFTPYAFTEEINPKEYLYLQHLYLVLLILSFAVLTRRNTTPYYDIDIKADKREFKILVTSDTSVYTVFGICQAMMVYDENGRQEKPQGFLKSASLPFLYPKWNLKHVLREEITANDQASLTFVVVP